MKALLKYCPDLRACELEDRLLPAILNLGATVLTTGGYVLLLSPFPVIAADPFGQTAGPGFLTPPTMSGSAGVSGLLPGNSPGVPGLAATAPTGSNGGAAVTILIGSGSNDAGAANIPLVTRNTVANDALSAAPVIGHASGGQSTVLPPEQTYRAGLPVTATVGFSIETPGQRAAQEPAQGAADPLPLRLGRRPHHLGSGASGNLIRSHADRAP
jgi:hypothetical protein